MTMLSDKIAVVTGASHGIGRAIALRFAKEGALVGVHYGKNQKAADETVSAIESAGGKAFPIKSEFGTEGDLDGFFDTLKKGLGGRSLDILVNNVGIGGQTGSIEHTSPQEFDRIFSINVRTPFFIIQRALPMMSDGGRIINISSGDMRVAIPGELAYSMSK